MRRPPNRLYCGDNLQILRERILSESIDLIYLDPPFKSDQDYNLLFRDKNGQRLSESQILAFEDTWEWNQEAVRTLEQTIDQGGKLGDAFEPFANLAGR